KPASEPVPVSAAGKDNKRGAAADRGADRESARGDLHLTPGEQDRTVRQAGHKGKSAAADRRPERLAADGDDLLAARADHRAAGPAARGDNFRAAVDGCAGGEANGRDDLHAAAEHRRVADHAVVGGCPIGPTGDDLYAAAED